MRKLKCEYCGYILIPNRRYARKWRKNNTAWTCPQCGEKNRPNIRRR